MVVRLIRWSEKYLSTWCCCRATICCLSLLSESWRRLLVLRFQWLIWIDDDRLSCVSVAVGFSLLLISQYQDLKCLECLSHHIEWLDRLLLNLPCHRLELPCNESSSLFRYVNLLLCVVHCRSLCLCPVVVGWLAGRLVKQQADRSKREINLEDLPPTRREFAFRVCVGWLAYPTRSTYRVRSMTDWQAAEAGCRSSYLAGYLSCVRGMIIFSFLVHLVCWW